MKMLVVWLGLAAMWAAAEAQGGFGGTFINCGRGFCDTSSSVCRCPSRQTNARGFSQVIVIIVNNNNRNPRCTCQPRAFNPPNFPPNFPPFNPPNGGGQCGFRRSGRPRFCNRSCQRCDFFSRRCRNLRIRGCRNGRPIRRRFRNFSFDQVNANFTGTLQSDQVGTLNLTTNAAGNLIASNDQVGQLNVTETSDRKGLVLSNDQMGNFTLSMDQVNITGKLSMDQMDLNVTMDHLDGNVTLSSDENNFNMTVTLDQLINNVTDADQLTPTTPSTLSFDQFESTTQSSFINFDQVDPGTTQASYLSSDQVDGATTQASYLSSDQIDGATTQASYLSSDQIDGATTQTYSIQI